MKSSAELTQQAAGYMLAAANAAKREAAANAAIMAELKSVTTSKVVESKLAPNANKPKPDPLQPLTRGEIANALFEAAVPKPSIYVPQTHVQVDVQACRCTSRCSGVCRQVNVRRHPGLQVVRRR